MNPALVIASVTASSRSRSPGEYISFTPYTPEPKQEIAGCICIEPNHAVSIVRSTTFPDSVDVRFRGDLAITEIDRLIYKLNKLKSSMLQLMEENK